MNITPFKGTVSMKYIPYFRFVFVLGIIAIISFLRWYFIYEQPAYGIDDANIYFVYAQNLAEGHGFVYNPGGEKVEGFTSVLWLLLVSVFFKTGQMEWLILITNLLLIAVSISYLLQFLVVLNKQETKLFPPPTLLTLAFLCLIPGYIDWTVLTMMETGLWSCLLVLTTVHLCWLFLTPDDHTKSRALWILLPLLVFTRPESLLWGLTFLFIRFSQLILKAKKQGTLFQYQAILPPFFTYIFSLGLLFTLRFSYFGYFFPNTFYAKVSQNMSENAIAGAYYLLRYVKENPFIAVFLILLFFATLLIVKKIRSGLVSTYDYLQLVIIFFVAISFLIPFYTGGDHFYLSRFYQPLHPLILLGVFNIPFWKQYFPDLIRKLQLYRMVVLVCCFILIFWLPRFTLLGPSPIKKEFDIALQGRTSGENLNLLFQPLPSFPSIGSYLAGGLAYAYAGEIIDLMGLNNTDIAHAPDQSKGKKNHSAFSKKAFFQLSPDLVHMGFISHPQQVQLTENDSSDFQNQVLDYIFLDQKFKNLYLPLVIVQPERELYYLTYVRRSYLPTLQKYKLQFRLIDEEE